MARERVKLNISKSIGTVEADESSFLSKLIAGCKGKVTINTPFGKREIQKIKVKKSE